MRSLLGLAILPFLLGMPISAGNAELSPDPLGPSMTVGTAHSHSVSLPLREMVACPGAPHQERFHRTFGETEERRNVNIEGIDRAEIFDGGCNGFVQSDDSGAVGRHHYVQVVNTSLAVFDKEGELEAGPVSTTTFWSNQPDCSKNPPGVASISDSVVIYDRHADRWVISRPGGPTRSLADLCLAVSQTSDPAGPYDQYAFEVNNSANGLDVYFNDYPKISAWPNSYFATANPNRIFCGLGNTISGFDRAAMLAGDPAPAFVTFFVPGPVPGSTMPDCTPAPSIPRTHMLPADLDGQNLPPPDAPGYIVQVQDQHLGFPAGRLQVYEFDIDWTNPSSATLTPTSSLTPQPFNSNACPGQSCIHQPTGPALDSLSYGYMMFRLSYRNFADHQTLLFNHTVAADGNPTHNHAGIRWYELRRTTKVPWFIHQQGTYAPDVNDRWLGSIAMDRHGNIALGFDVSGTTEFPSIHYVTRRPVDPLGQLPRSEVSIIEGRGAQTGGNDGLIFFGDYSQMTVDPRDDCTFWYTNTYYPLTMLSDLWHTRIAAFRFPDCHRPNGDEDEDEE